MGGLSAIGIVRTGVKNIREIALFLASLNGWTVLALLSVLGLAVFAVVSYMQWLDSRFARLRTEMTNGFNREAGGRGGEHAWILLELQARDARLSKLEAKPSSAKDFVRPG
jgi:hypothetical protein